MLLPRERTFNWVYIFLIMFAINFGSILISQWLMETAVDWYGMAGYGLISLVIAALICLGYFGLYVYALGLIIADFVGIVNMFYVSVADKGDVWTGIISIFMFLFIILIGMLTSLLIELIFRFKGNKINEDKQITKKRKKRRHKKS